ncbi:MAG TPA: aldo/keto reductase [Terriglobales bacterium]|nr:aldo/keto reductase [Terriglobales bacterium]
MNCSKCGSSLNERIVRVRPRIIVMLYLAGFAFAYFYGGAVLHDMIEGLARTPDLFVRLLLPAVVLASITAVAFLRFRQQVCPRCNEASPAWLMQPLELMRSALEITRGETRRSFLTTAGKVGAGVAAAAGGVGTAVLANRDWIPVARDFFVTKVDKVSPNPRDEWKSSKIASYRRLGRTNAMVSDISLGSAGINKVSVAEEAIDRGINYFDTSPDYADALSEKTLGEAMKGRRDKIFLATKFCRPNGHLLNDTPVPEIMSAVEDSLRRLQTDYVDLIHIHSCDRLDRLNAPNIHEAFGRLKEQGKVRFLGFSCHSPGLEDVANAAIDSGRFDVMMLAYHFGMWPNFGDIVERAHKADMGVVAMKTLKGAKHTNLANFQDEATSYAQSAFKWVLSNPAVACLVVSMSEHQQVAEYVYASGKAVTTEDVATLEKYDKLIAGDYCQPHCGQCLSSCPQELAINDILRYRMYFKDYGREKEGMQLYAKLDKNGRQCLDCAAPCEAACPINVRIHDNMLDADRLLSFVG